MDVASFAEIQSDLESRVSRIVWCTVATVDTKGRTRVRILHPMWEGQTAWICTNRHSVKERHLARNPFVSLSYWDPKHEQVYADCRAEWADAPAEKQRIWDLFKSTPQPYGYDPAMFWPGGPGGDDFGVLKCTPWRIQLGGLTAAGFENRVWRAPGSAAAR